MTCAGRPTGWQVRAISRPRRTSAAEAESVHAYGRSCATPGSDAGPRSTTSRPCAPGWPPATTATGRVGVIGYCMGVAFALMLAPAGGPSAAGVNYGTAAKDVYSESFLDAACPIVGSYGAKDRVNRGAGERLKQVLMAAGVEHDIKTYPDAGHSFLNDHDSVDIPALFAVLLRLTVSQFHEPSAIDARRRIVGFFDLHLKS